MIDGDENARGVTVLADCDDVKDAVRFDPADRFAQRLRGLHAQHGDPGVAVQV